MRAGIAGCLVSLAVASCNQAPKIVPDTVHRFGDTVTTTGEKGEMFEDGFGIAFLDIDEDSRCPKNVTCVWAGAATVTLSCVVKGDEQNPGRLRLSTAPESRRHTAYKGYQIELIDVAPYPESSTKIPSAEYRVTLRVSRAS